MMSWIDWKLGWRMLVKFPGLTVVGGLTLALTIGLGAGWFEITEQLLNPRLPLDQGDRIVRLETWDAVESKLERRSLYDLEVWRTQLTAVRELGAARSLERNLIAPDGSASTAAVAEISPSAFALTRVPPEIGRTLIEADATPGAPDVVVLGYDVWQNRFNGDRGVIDRTIRIGPTPATIVGVMPPGFAFPESHEVWIPLRFSDPRPRQGPTVEVFGRLIDGATMESVEAELTTVGQRIAIEHPSTHAQLRPRVLPFAAPDAQSGTALMIRGSNLLAWLILAAACGNVATLLFARTASREAEIAVRTALGASRARIMMQFFVEALVLCLIAAVVGLAGASVGIEFVVRLFIEDEYNVRLPFWWQFGIRPATVVYTAALAAGGAALVALLPALKATGKRVVMPSSTGSTRMRFGGVWSFLIVVQVASAALCLPFGAAGALWTLRGPATRADFPLHEYLTVRPELDRDAVAGVQVRDAAGGAQIEESSDQFRARLMRAYDALQLRIERDPAVAGVTFGNAFPGMSTSLRKVEAQRGSEPPFLVDAEIEGDRVRTMSVATDYFETVGLPVIAGRGLLAGDVAAQNVAVINDMLALHLRGAPLGVRIRYAASARGAPASPWYEVVGVVRDDGQESPVPDRVFLPVSVASADPLYVGVHVRGDAAAFAPRLRALAAEADPGLRLYDVLSLDEIVRRNERLEMIGMLALLGATLLVTALSAAGLYSLMAVAVTRRTREIGIRIALGASPRMVLAALFRRAAIQVGIGIVVATVLMPSMMTALGISELRPGMVFAMMAIAAGGMVVTSLIACAVPARRALRIQPSEAVKTDG
jgi:predicted permease